MHNQEGVLRRDEKGEIAEEQQDRSGRKKGAGRSRSERRDAEGTKSRGGAGVVTGRESGLWCVGSSGALRRHELTTGVVGEGREALRRN